MASKKFPTDELDSLPEHGGRHRARRTARDRVREFLRVLVVATIVAGLGLFALRVVDASLMPQATAGDLLDAGLNVLTAANYDSSTAADQTVILISDESYRSTATKVSRVIGKYPIEVTAEFTDPVTVVIAADFKQE